MHSVTEAVRAMYSAYPYPAGAPKLRQGTDVRLLLGAVERGRARGGPLRVLDAGCGRGVGLIAAALLQPDVEFLGVDLCARSLAEAQAEARARGLKNVRFAEIDLMSLAGLELPTGGFDVIYSSGVVHHLVDPQAGLARLAECLAPHGVLSLMVYGRRGRESLYRLVRAVDALAPRELALDERLAQARQLVKNNQGPTLTAGPWEDQQTISNVEFVDRYLNVHETSYDVPGFMELINGAKLKFLRWMEPQEWEPASVLAPGPQLTHVQTLPALRRYCLVDELSWRPALEALLCQPDNTPRAPANPNNLEQAPLAWNPEATLTVRRRNGRAGQRVEQVEVTVRRQPPQTLTGPSAQVALLLEHQLDPFQSSALETLAGEHGLTRNLCRQALLDLLQKEALFRLHPNDA